MGDSSSELVQGTLEMLVLKTLALMPLPTDRRNEGQQGVDVQIQGVWVRPGDWLYADEDGMVVLDRPA